jgi:hypothetical protein
MRIVVMYLLAAVGGLVYVGIADGFGLTGLEDIAVFAGCILVFGAPGVYLTNHVEPGGLRRWRRTRV